MNVIPAPTHPGQESVWSYPRPAVAESSHPPSYYFPPNSIAPLVLQPSRRCSFCEWKGEAIYFDILVHTETLRDHVAFYAGPSRERRAAASGDGRVGIEKMLRMRTLNLIHF